MLIPMWSSLFKKFVFCEIAVPNRPKTSTEWMSLCRNISLFHMWRFFRMNTAFNSSPLPLRPLLDLELTGKHTPHLMGQLDCFSAENLAKTAWSLGALGVPLLNLGPSLAAAVGERAGDFTPEELANAAWGLANYWDRGCPR